MGPSKLKIYPLYYYINFFPLKKKKSISIAYSQHVTFSPVPKSKKQILKTHRHTTDLQKKREKKKSSLNV